MKIFGVKIADETDVLQSKQYVELNIYHLPLNNFRTNEKKTPMHKFP